MNAHEQLVAKVAAFLKERDEAFIVSDEQTDTERADSAKHLLALIGDAIKQPTVHMLAGAREAWLNDPCRKSSTLWAGMFAASPLNGGE